MRSYVSPFMVPTTLGDPDDPICPQLDSGGDRCELPNHHEGRHYRVTDDPRGLATEWYDCPTHAVEGHQHS